ncbi:MAG TPA: hypothetical protein VFT43_09800 [Candidatus Polarisedimenticolia bacterium]|nr:hypothetical protein [Candidatus Polarisedimenticolia bacterium]
MKGRFVTLVAVLLALLTTATPLLAKKKTLRPEDNWNVKITPDAGAAARGEKASSDTLILKEGFLRLRGGVEQGFGAAPYKLEGNVITAQTRSSSEGKIDWTTNWTGDTIAGRMVWTKKDGAVLTYTFSGTRAPVEKAKKKKS